MQKGPPKLDNSQLIELVAYLQGTCNTLAEGMRACEFEEFDEDDAAIRVGSEGELFLCESCSWWCEESERTMDVVLGDVCDDCKPEGDE